jgi:hypothetical protein
MLIQQSRVVREISFKGVAVPKLSNFKNAKEVRGPSGVWKIRTFAKKNLARPLDGLRQMFNFLDNPFSNLQ